MLMINRDSLYRDIRCFGDVYHMVLALYRLGFSKERYLNMIEDGN